MDTLYYSAPIRSIQDHISVSLVGNIACDVWELIIYYSGLLQIQQHYTRLTWTTFYGLSDIHNFSEWISKNISSHACVGWIARYNELKFNNIWIDSDVSLPLSTALLFFWFISSLFNRTISACFRSCKFQSPSPPFIHILTHILLVILRVGMGYAQMAYMGNYCPVWQRIQLQ